MNRRDFLKTAALAAAAVAVNPTNLLAQTSQTKSDRKSKGEAADLVAVMGGEPDEMFQRAIAEIGGMKRFVGKGQKVCIKPNIGWDRIPERAGNTNPILVAAIVRECFAAGASKVVVFDHTCDNWVKCYQNSGIESAVKQAGAEMMPANTENYYREVTLPKGLKLTKTKIHEAILDCDVWINVPILKHHGGANLTSAMKNYMGIVWDRGAFHLHGLQQCIADVCTFDKPAALNIVDAYRVLYNNGPQGRSDSDVKLTKALFMSPDVVAVDTAACHFFNQVRTMPLDTVRHIAFGESHQLGTTQLDRLSVKRIKL